MSMAMTSILWGDLRKTLWAKKQGSLRKENPLSGACCPLYFLSISSLLNRFFSNSLVAKTNRPARFFSLSMAGKFNSNSA